MGLLEGKKVVNANKILVLSIGLLLITRAVTFIAMPNPTNSPDSPTYFSGKFLDFSLVSLTGHASRGWVVPLFYSLMPNLVILELFQLLLSALAWIFLVTTIRSISTLAKVPKQILVLLIGVLGSSPQVVQHDTSVLSTSVTNSLFILLLTVLIRAQYSEKTPKINLFLGISLSGLLMVQKTSFLPIAIGICSLLILAVYKLLSTKTKLIGLFTIIVMIFYGISVGNNVNSNWQISYSGQTLLWQLGGQSPSALEFSSYLRSRNAPNCITADAPYQNLDVSIGRILNECPEAEKYIESEIQRDFINFIFTNPIKAAELGVFGLGATVTSSASNYGGSVSILPRFVDDIFFGSTTPQINSTSTENQVAGLKLFESGSAFWLFTPLLGWIFLMVFGFIFQRESRKEDTFLYLLFVFCLLQSLMVVILLPSEWMRQTSPFIISALIISVILSVKNLHAIFGGVARIDRSTVSK
jgi:hypothetical protein